MLKLHILVLLILTLSIFFAKTSCDSGGGSTGYTQAWLRGEGPVAHAHEGIRLADKSGWVAIGETLDDEGFRKSQVRIYLSPTLLTMYVLCPGPGEAGG